MTVSGEFRGVLAFSTTKVIQNCFLHFFPVTIVLSICKEPFCKRIDQENGNLNGWGGIEKWDFRTVKIFITD